MAIQQGPNHILCGVARLGSIARVITRCIYEEHRVPGTFLSCALREHGGRPNRPVHPFSASC